MISIDDNYHIEWIHLYVVLVYKVTPYTATDRGGKEKTVTPTDRWYYPNIEVALNGYIHKKLENQQQQFVDEDVKEVLLAIGDLRKTIKEFFKTIKHRLDNDRHI